MSEDSPKLIKPVTGIHKSSWGNLTWLFARENRSMSPKSMANSHRNTIMEKPAKNTNTLRLFLIQ